MKHLAGRLLLQYERKQEPRQPIGQHITMGFAAAASGNSHMSSGNASPLFAGTQAKHHVLLKIHRTHNAVTLSRYAPSRGALAITCRRHRRAGRWRAIRMPTGCWEEGGSWKPRSGECISFPSLPSFIITHWECKLVCVMLAHCGQHFLKQQTQNQRLSLSDKTCLLYHKAHPYMMLREALHILLDAQRLFLGMYAYLPLLLSLSLGTLDRSGKGIFCHNTFGLGPQNYYTFYTQALSCLGSAEY